MRNFLIVSLKAFLRGTASNDLKSERDGAKELGWECLTYFSEAREHCVASQIG